jgi:hypothetical protein
MNQLGCPGPDGWPALFRLCMWGCLRMKLTLKLVDCEWNRGSPYCGWPFPYFEGLSSKEDPPPQSEGILQHLSLDLNRSASPPGTPVSTHPISQTVDLPAPMITWADSLVTILFCGSVCLSAYYRLFLWRVQANGPGTQRQGWGSVECL